MRAPSLIDIWLAGETAIPGRSIADALRDLAEDTGQTVVTHSRLAEWRDGRSELPMWARRYMAEVAADHIIAVTGGEYEAVRDILLG